MASKWRDEKRMNAVRAFEQKVINNGLKCNMKSFWNGQLGRLKRIYRRGGGAHGLESDEDGGMLITSQPDGGRTAVAKFVDNFVAPFVEHIADAEAIVLGILRVDAV